MITCLGKKMFIRFTMRLCRELLSICACVCVLLESEMWDFIVLVPDHCLKFYRSVLKYWDT